MGDRVIIILHSADKTEVGPAIYLHWSGHGTPDLIKRLAVVMAERRDDVSYASARLVALVCGDHPGNMSVGVSSLEDGDAKAIRRGASIFHISQGDAGVVLVNAATFEWTASGGYLARAAA